MYDYESARVSGGQAAPAPPTILQTLEDAHVSAAAGDHSTAIIAAYKEENVKLIDALRVLRDSGGSGACSDVLEGRYLAQIRKAKNLAVELSSEKLKSKTLGEQLEAATAKATALESDVRLLQKQISSERERHSAGVGGMLRLLTGDTSVHQHRQNNSNHSSQENDLETGEGIVDGAKDRPERRCYALIREKDLQLADLRREVAAMKAVLSWETGRPGEELEAWVKHVTASRGGAVSALGKQKGWKGRAEQIVLLQGKITDLERALAEGRSVPDGGRRGGIPATTGDPNAIRNDDFIRHGGGDDLESLMALAKGARSPRSASPHHPSSGPTTSAHPSYNNGKKSVDDEARDRVQEIMSKRQQAHREAIEELKHTQTALHEETSKLAAMHARFLCLQRENTQLKSQLSVMLNKSCNDDALVAAYKEELVETHRSMQEMKVELEDRRAGVWGGPETEGAPAQGNTGGGPPQTSQRNHRFSPHAVPPGPPADGSSVSGGGVQPHELRDALAEARQVVEDCESEKSTMAARLQMLERLVAQYFALDNGGDDEAVVGSHDDVKDTQDISLVRQLLEWVMRAVAAASTDCHQGAVQPSQKPTENAHLQPLLGHVLRAAHAHVLLVEQQHAPLHHEAAFSQYQRWVEAVQQLLNNRLACSASKKDGEAAVPASSLAAVAPQLVEKLTAHLAALPPLSPQLLQEVRHLKARIQSLTALIRKDSAALVTCTARSGAAGKTHSH